MLYNMYKLIRKKKKMRKIYSNKNYVNDYVVFDIETTGFNPINDKIIEIGAVKYINNKKVDEFSYLINPKIKLPDIITKVTGITDDDLIGKSYIEDVLPKFLDFIEGFTIIGHNVGFDISFIDSNNKKLGYNELKNNVIDTLFLSRINIYDTENHKLETLKKYLGLNFISHRAVDDCYTCNEVYQYCKNKSEANYESSK